MVHRGGISGVDWCGGSGSMVSPRLLNAEEKTCANLGAGVAAADDGCAVGLRNTCSGGGCSGVEPQLVGWCRDLWREACAHHAQEPWWRGMGAVRSLAVNAMSCSNRWLPPRSFAPAHMCVARPGETAPWCDVCVCGPAASAVAVGMAVSAAPIGLAAVVERCIISWRSLGGGTTPQAVPPPRSRRTVPWCAGVLEDGGACSVVQQQLADAETIRAAHTACACVQRSGSGVCWVSGKSVVIAVRLSSS